MLVAAAVLVAAVTASWWVPLVLRPFGFFAVRRIEVQGSRYLSASQLVAALGLGPRSSVWTSLGELTRRVAELPGVASARVTRRLPATLVVTVTEEEPVALAVGSGGGGARGGWMVAVDRQGRPLPYDPAREPVDAPVIRGADPVVVAALGAVQDADAGLFADVATARAAAGGGEDAGGAGGGGGVVLELGEGRVRLGTPVDPAVVRAVAAVRRDLKSRGEAWRELDGRYKGWVVVRRASAAGAGAARAA